MKLSIRRIITGCCFVCLLVTYAFAESPLGFIEESAREIPVAYDVDVVVIGGSTGAVAAAVSAAEQGAEVFLAAPLSYLGEDVCATYRLWLDPDEVPQDKLAQAVFAEAPLPNIPCQNPLPFTYTSDRPSAARHPDTNKQTLLSDKKWHAASTQSVQYDGDVTITATLAETEYVDAVSVLVYQRPGDFAVAGVDVSVSQDGQVWQSVGLTHNAKLQQGRFEAQALDIKAPVKRQSRYLKIEVHKTEAVQRILLGEICISGLGSDTQRSSGLRRAPTPMQVKQTLDKVLLDAGVSFLYGCYATEILHDTKGRLAGIVMANRSGRQSVKAKLVIDASSTGVVARMAGATFTARGQTRRPVKRIVIGGEATPSVKIEKRKLPMGVTAHDYQAYDAYEYSMDLSWDETDVSSHMSVDQELRDRSWRRAQVDASERFFHIPRMHVRSEAGTCLSWPGAAKVNLDHLAVKNVKRLFVLSGCADLSLPVAQRLMAPLDLIEVGRRLGALIGREATTLRRTKNPVVYAGKDSTPIVAHGELGDDPSWSPPQGKDLGSVRSPKHYVPVLGSYDVVVVGGGTGGAPAGIAAARLGAKTLVLEYLHGLGGIGTQGLISTYYHGNRCGFTTEIDSGLGKLGGPAEGNSGKGKSWDTQLKSEWFRRELRHAGADIWFGALGCGAFTQDKAVTGVVVATEWGRGVVLAKTVIDATGHAVIAAAAGAPHIYTGPSHIAVQGTGLPPRQLGVRYTNTDYTFVDDLDVFDAWRVFLTSKEKFKGAYDLGQLIDTRERRQIRGDLFLTPVDAYAGRTYPDTIVLAKSNFDTHGFTIHPMFMLRPPDRQSVPTYVPYRCLLPQGLEGLLVTGLGISAHRDVMPVIRMQPDVQNQGYAAGVAAAMAVGNGTNLREIDIRELQRHLVQKGVLEEEVLEHEDSFPLSQETVADAVCSVTQDYDDLEVLFAHEEQAKPMLRAAYEKAERREDKLAYAHVLAFMGDPLGTTELVETVRSNKWDKGWAYRGMGQFGRNVSALDSFIIALGCTGQTEVLTPILDKVRELGPEHAFSHHRAVAMALEMLGTPAAATELAALLKKPGMSGHAFVNIQVARDNIQTSRTDNTTREKSLRELVLARALYRCGDFQGLGEKILQSYARDLRGHYRRHAQAILAGNTK